MTFSIYALIGDKAPIVTIESLASDLRRFFRNEEKFSFKFEQLPFARMRVWAQRLRALSQVTSSAKASKSRYSVEWTHRAGGGLRG